MISFSILYTYASNLYIFCIDSQRTIFEASKMSMIAKTGNPVLGSHLVDRHFKDFL